MRRRIHALIPLLLLVVIGLGGMAIRSCELTDGFDEAGLPVSCAARYVLIAVSVLAVILAALIGLMQKPRPEYEKNFCRGGVIAMLAGALTAAGALIEGLDSLSSTATTLLWLLGVVSGLCMVVIGLAWIQKKRPFLALHLIPSAFMLILLIVWFRSWSMDPVIPDYCYSLFAVISILLALFYLGGFCFGQGKRRMSLFWCLAAVFFCPVAVAGNTTGVCLLFGGFFLFLFQSAAQLLWPDED